MRASRQFLNMTAACTCRRFRQILTANDSRTGSTLPGMFVHAALDLDGDVAEALEIAQPLLVDRGLQRRIRDQRYHRGAVAGTELPDVQIGDAVVTLLQPHADRAFHVLVK